MVREPPSPDIEGDEHPSASTRALIDAARAARGILHRLRLTAPAESSVAGALRARAREAPGSPFLLWRGEDPEDRLLWT